MVGYALVVGPAPRSCGDRHDRDLLPGRDRRRLDRPANTLALAALGTLAVNPSYLFDVGCQLSFLAIGTLDLAGAAGMLRWSRWHLKRCEPVLSVRVTPLDRARAPARARRRAQPLRRAGGFVVDGLVASDRGLAGGLPLVAMRFHLISPIGILLNIPLIPLTTAALLLGGLGPGGLDDLGAAGSPSGVGRGLVVEADESHRSLGRRQPWGHRFVVGPAWAWVLVFYSWFSSSPS